MIHMNSKINYQDKNMLIIDEIDYNTIKEIQSREVK